MAKMCLDPSALFVLSPKQADWFNCPGPLNMSSKNPPSGEKNMINQWTYVDSDVLLQNLWKSPIPTISFRTVGTYT